MTKLKEDVAPEKLRTELLKLLTENGPMGGREMARQLGLEESYSKVTYNLKQLEASHKIKRTEKNNRLSPYAINNSAPKPRTDDIPDAPLKRVYTKRGGQNGNAPEGMMTVKQYLIRDIRNKLAELEAMG